MRVERKGTKRVGSRGRRRERRKREADGKGGKQRR